MDLKEIAMQLTLKALETDLIVRADYANASTYEEGVVEQANLVNAFYTSVYDNLFKIYNRKA